MKIFFRCQGCSRRLGVDDSQAGRVGNCPDCDFVFVVPEKSDPEFAVRGKKAHPPALRGGRQVEGYSRRQEAKEIEDVEELGGFEKVNDLEEEGEPPPRVKKGKKRRKKTAPSGAPDVFLPILLFVTLLLSAGFALSIPFPVVGHFVLWGAWVIGMGSGIWVLVIAYEEDPVCLVLILLVPFYSLYYLVTRWSNTWRSFLLSTVGGIFMIMAVIRMFAAGVSELKAEFKAMHQNSRQPDNRIFLGTPAGQQPWMANPADMRRPGR